MKKQMIRTAKIWLPCGGALIIWAALTDSSAPVMLFFPLLLLSAILGAFGDE